MADSDQLAAPSLDASRSPATLGGTLQQARLVRDLSLEQISAELRIETRQLDALEKDQFERIGVPVFVKGYIKQYGAFLGLDYRDLLAQYYQQNALKEIQIQPSKTITLRDERQITVWIVALFILAALGVAFAVWWMNGGVLPGTISSSDAQTRVDLPVVPISVESRAPPPSAPRSEPAPAATVAADAASPAPAAPPAAITLAVAPEAVAANAAPSQSASVAAAGAPTLAPGQTAVAQLDVAFEQESWAEISDARGQRLFYGMAPAGRNTKLNGEPPFAVVLGNASGVRIALDGADFPVPSSGRTGFARFSVDVAEE